MTTKRSEAELLEHYYQGLISLLPMKDANFTEDLFKHDLLPRDVKIKLETLISHKERASYFLDNVIKPRIADCDNQCFGKLLTVMKISNYENVKDLAKQIETEYAINAKCKFVQFYYIICVHTYCMYIRT